MADTGDRLDRHARCPIARAEISGHSGAAGRAFVAAIDLGSFELWRARFVRGGQGWRRRRSARSSRSCARFTEKPFAMNLWVSMEDASAKASDAAAFDRSVTAIAPQLEALGCARANL